jgi:hypothetical protein
MLRTLAAFVRVRLRLVVELGSAVEPGKKICVPITMTDEDEGLYFAKCERRERAMSRRSPDPRAAAAHAEMADRYEALAVIFGTKHPIDIPVDYH